MKHIYPLFACLILMASAISCSHYKYDSVKGDSSAMRIYTLDNGLKVYMCVNHDQPRIDAQVAVKVGSKNDPRETTGLAHYFEHLMFKGTEQFGTQNYELEKPMLDRIDSLFEIYRQTEEPSLRKAIYHQIDSISYEASKIAIPNEYDKLMASIGASGTNAYTSYDVTCYVENIPSNQIENWAKIQADRFENVVLRGFHTELETIYEEYNMYAALDQTKSFNALFEGLFEKHPYRTDVIGYPEHLKNPSVTNVRNYHEQWYVPNNMAVVLSGDFNPDETIAIVDRYFGALKPNENLQPVVFEPEKPIEAPVVKDVLGNEAPNITLAWRFPGANRPESLMIDLVANVLYNGEAGLIDLDVNQQQKVLEMYAGSDALADYSVFEINAQPKAGQSLEEVKEIAFEEIEKLKKGDFDDELLESIVNNMKLKFIRSSESTRSMARMAVNSFINDDSWENCYVNYINRLSAITKEELVAFVNDNIKDNYVQVNKLQQRDPADTRIAKPAITPIFTNRDTSSLFLRQMQAAAAAVQPIEPQYVDYNKDMSKLEGKSGIEILYKKNESNDIFTLQYIIEKGTATDKEIATATDYLDYLGTGEMSAVDIKKEFYKLACSFDCWCGEDRTTIRLTGLKENMDKAMTLMENLISDCRPDADALELLKGNILLARDNSKHDQRENFWRLTSYALYGPLNPDTFILSSDELKSLTAEYLVEKIHNIFNDAHLVTYYGPSSCDELVEAIERNHKCPEELAPVVGGIPFKNQVIDENEVMIAPYDANQLYLYSLSNRGEKYDREIEPMTRLYNEYFGGGMNAIVFQEMREARGLAYSASARYSLPRDLEHDVTFYSVIQTQNDKLIDALTAFDEIINNMPVSQKSFDIAKESILTNIRTKRIVKGSVLDSYLSARRLGIDYDLRRDVFEKVSGYTLDDVVAFQQQNIKDRKYKVVILGREGDLDMDALKNWGPITGLTTEQIFGY